MIIASGGDGIPVELFQILKDDAVKVHHSIYQELWKTQQWPQDWKRSVFIPIPESGKESSDCCTIALVSHTSKERKESEVAQSCLTLRPHGLQPTGSSVDEIFQARTVKWVAISFSNA